MTKVPIPLHHFTTSLHRHLNISPPYHLICLLLCLLAMSCQNGKPVGEEKREVAEDSMDAEKYAKEIEAYQEKLKKDRPILWPIDTDTLKVHKSGKIWRPDYLEFEGIKYIGSNFGSTDAYGGQMTFKNDPTVIEFTNGKRIDILNGNPLFDYDKYAPQLSTKFTDIYANMRKLKLEPEDLNRLKDPEYACNDCQDDTFLFSYDVEHKNKHVFVRYSISNDTTWEQESATWKSALMVYDSLGNMLLDKPFECWSGWIGYEITQDGVFLGLQYGGDGFGEEGEIIVKKAAVKVMDLRKQKDVLTISKMPNYHTGNRYFISSKTNDSFLIADSKNEDYPLTVNYYLFDAKYSDFYLEKEMIFPRKGDGFEIRNNLFYNIRQNSMDTIPLKLLEVFNKKMF